MKPIRCIFGRHAYKPSNDEVYFCGEENGILEYRSINYCIYCGKKVEVLFETKDPLKFVDERREDG